MAVRRRRGASAAARRFGGRVGGFAGRRSGRVAAVVAVWSVAVRCDGALGVVRCRRRRSVWRCRGGVHARGRGGALRPRPPHSLALLAGGTSPRCSSCGGRRRSWAGRALSGVRGTPGSDSPAAHPVAVVVAASAALAPAAGGLPRAGLHVALRLRLGRRQNFIVVPALHHVVAGVDAGLRRAILLDVRVAVEKGAQSRWCDGSEINGSTLTFALPDVGATTP